MKQIRHGKEYLRRSGIMGIAMGVIFLGITIGFSVAVGEAIPLIMGLIFACFAIGSGIHSLWQAGKEDRPALYEITEDKKAQQGGAKFCPYCGNGVGDGYLYCSRCGKKLP
ncbi:MAG: zinc ribbon domain-containing protein [Clostridia bacterium]|nr:zinc ribbon domain-containing protein [Clostridia bacterium]MBO5258550.1 zinc ribbon domain-containing protein [Clostridia bacterium]MBQ7314357.1 zinc ribbon domain-containing protein [Clostridia bacterium]